ncbi:MAG: outer membrane lipid asymmetry maintenance protein MlaD [Alphaproteobacteria bacterium]
MRGTVVETLIGAAVLAVAAGFFFMAYSRTDHTPTSGYELSANFDRVGGLAIGSDVRVSGIKVGSVLSQELDPNTFEAVLVMGIEAGIELPEDSSAKIGQDGLLGGSFVDLEPGGSPDMLADGDQIEFTQGAIDLIGLVGRLVYGSTGDSEDSE